MNSTEQIVVNKYYVPDKPDFMTKKRLAEELCRSVDYVDELIKNRVLIEEVHYTKVGRTLTFFYPQIKKDLAPKRANML
jgi:hypothetical protein